MRTATRTNIKNDQAAYLMRSAGRRRPSVPNAKEIIRAKSNMDCRWVKGLCMETSGLPATGCFISVKRGQKIEDSCGGNKARAVITR